MGQVSKVYNEGWFNCFVSFANNGASTQCCQEVLIGAGITEDEAYEFMESGECTGQARTEIEDYVLRHMRIHLGDEDEESNVGDF